MSTLEPRPVTRDMRRFEAVADALIRTGATGEMKTAVLAALMDCDGVQMMSASRYRDDPAIRALFASRGVTLLDDNGPGGRRD